jgi:hypothetical protein
MELEGCNPRLSTVTKMLIATRAERLNLVQEKAVFGVLDDPLQSLLEVLAGHGAARHDPPLVRVNVV